MRRTFSRFKVASVIPLPVNLGQPFLGTDLAPSLLIDNGLFKLLASLGWRVLPVPEIIAHPPQKGVLLETPHAKNCAQVGRVCEEIYHKVAEHAQTDNFLLILGGDHCIPIGTIPAIRKHRPNTGVVWVDAHADINTPTTSGSGNMHGMPLGFLLNLVERVKELPSMHWFSPPYLEPRNLVYIGLRDLDEGEKKAVKRLGIKAFTMYDVDRKGIGRVMEEAEAHLKHCDGIHLSYDIDAIDPFYAPHTGTAVRGGLTFREANYICEALHMGGKLRSMELVEVNPALHGEIDTKLTTEMSMTLIGSAMGQTIL